MKYLVAGIGIGGQGKCSPKTCYQYVPDCSDFCTIHNSCGVRDACSFLCETLNTCGSLGNDCIGGGSRSEISRIG